MPPLVRESTRWSLALVSPGFTCCTVYAASGAPSSNLPPALVVTCELAPLRDEGVAYADALHAAGVAVRHLPCRGQIHTSLHAVDVIASSAGARQEMALALREFSRAGVPA